MMEPDRWKQIEHWFHEALEHRDPASRELFLSRIEDSDIRREVADPSSKRNARLPARCGQSTWMKR